MKPEKELSGEELSRYVAKLFEEKGRKALEIARNAMAEEIEKLECEEAREALKYFMDKYWRDTTRPALLSIACEALGGNPDLTTPIAVPLILISGAIDIHDDIIDQSKTKLNRPTVYGKFGKDIALLIGDALLFKGFTLLHEASKKLPLEKVHAILEILKKSFFELGDAEALELSLRKRKRIRVEEYVEFVRRKGADFEAYMRISAILAGASEEETEALGRYGQILGMLVILGDDNADMLDSSELINRIKNEVLPFPIICALHKPTLKKKITPFLQKKKLTRKDAENIFNIIYEAEIFKEIENCFTKLINEARNNLKNIKNSEVLMKALKSAHPKENDRQC
ncbi:MAG: polyprenyl synthetase family protein [Candidatus Bathyarchaeia archaeon]